MVITVSCPACDTSFPVDPKKIPEGGVKVRCSECADVFRVEPAAPEIPELTPTPTPDTASDDDGWAIERDAFEEVSAAEEPDKEAAPESLPDGGSELPDWAASAGTGVEDAPGDLPEVEPPPELEMEPLAELEMELEPETSPAGLAEPDPLDWAAEIQVDPPVAEEEVIATPEPTSAPEPEPTPVQGFTFGKRDPLDKARRLARVLVSDMVMYNAERHQLALSRGTLEEDFEEEIEKSWKEFVDQVGSDIAEGEGQGFWRQALNDILAKGSEVF